MLVHRLGLFYDAIGDRHPEAVFHMREEDAELVRLLGWGAACTPPVGVPDEAS
jgi:hypothetical protein